MPTGASAGGDGHAGQSSLLRLVPQRIECLADTIHAAEGFLQFIGREENQERLPVQSQMGRFLEKFDPFVATGIPVLRPDAKTFVICHQQAELQTLDIGSLQVQVEGVVERRRLGLALRVIPVEGPEGDVVVGTIVDLLLHDLHGVVLPAPDRLPVGILGRQQLGEVDFVGLAAPAVEVVGTDQSPKLLRSQYAAVGAAGRAALPQSRPVRTDENLESKKTPNPHFL